MCPQRIKLMACPVWFPPWIQGHSGFLILGLLLTPLRPQTGLFTHRFAHLQIEKVDTLQNFTFGKIKYLQHLSHKHLKCIFSLLTNSLTFGETDNMAMSSYTWSQIIFPIFPFIPSHPTNRLEVKSDFSVHFLLPVVLADWCVPSGPHQLLENEKQRVFSGRKSPRYIIKLPNRNSFFGTNQIASKMLPLGNTTDLICVNVGINGPQSFSIAFW